MRDAVLQQLEKDSQVDASDIGVTATNGAVTMTGFVDSYAGKLAAERAARRVRRVRAVANDVQVRARLDRTDADIASDAARALNHGPVERHRARVLRTGVQRKFYADG